MKNKNIIKISALAIVLICSASQIKADGVSIGSEEHSLNIGAGRRVRNEGISIGSKEHSLNISTGERKYYNRHHHYRKYRDGSTFRERHPYTRSTYRKARQNYRD